MYIKILIIIATISIFSTFFVLQTKKVGEWTLRVMSYSLFLLFIIIQGYNKMTNLSIIILFLGLILNAFDNFMIKFCWDFIFQYFNKEALMFTWFDAKNNLKRKINSHKTILIREQIFDDTVRYDLETKDSFSTGWRYLLNYHMSITVSLGEIKIIFKKDNKEVILKKDDFIIIKEKEIYNMEFISDTAFKITCHKQ